MSGEGCSSSPARLPQRPHLLLLLLNLKELIGLKPANQSSESRYRIKKGSISDRPADSVSDGSLAAPSPAAPASSSSVVFAGSSSSSASSLRRIDTLINKLISD